MLKSKLNKLNANKKYDIRSIPSFDKYLWTDFSAWWTKQRPKIRSWTIFYAIIFDKPWKSVLFLAVEFTCLLAIKAFFLSFFSLSTAIRNSIKSRNSMIRFFPVSLFVLCWVRDGSHYQLNLALWLLIRWPWGFPREIGPNLVQDFNGPDKAKAHIIRKVCRLSRSINSVVKVHFRGKRESWTGYWPQRRTLIFRPMKLISSSIEPFQIGLAWRVPSLTNHPFPL